MSLANLETFVYKSVDWPKRAEVENHLFSPETMIMVCWFWLRGSRSLGTCQKPRALPPFWPQTLGTWLERPSFNQFPIVKLRSPVACLCPAFPVITQADADCAITGLSGGKSAVDVPVENAGTFEVVATGREACATLAASALHTM